MQAVGFFWWERAQNFMFEIKYDHLYPVLNTATPDC